MYMKTRPMNYVAVALFAVLIMSSCVRDYTCQCTVKYSGAPGLPDSSTREYAVRDKKSKAKSTCEGKSGTYQTGNIKTVETCRLY